MSYSSTDEGSPEKRPLCKFLVLKGHCRFGDSCQFSHEGCSTEEAGKQIPCVFFLRGNCRYGEYCKLRHDVSDLYICTPVDDNNEKERHQQQKQKYQEHLCGICWEDVKTKARNILNNNNNNDADNDDVNHNSKNNHWNANKFGLLLNCDHCFCHSCLQEWRKSKSCNKEVTKACPTCRQPSDFIIPSDKFYKHGSREKESFVQGYKDRLGKIPCKMFSGTIGSCPFGPICLYAHRGPNGEDLKPFDKKKKQFVSRRRNNNFWRQQIEQQIEEEILLDDFNTFMSLLMSYSGHDGGILGTSDYSDPDDNTQNSDDDDDDDDDDLDSRLFFEVFGRT